MASVTIQLIRELVRRVFPTVKAGERGILLAIAAAQEEGRDVGIKQLMISEAATGTTVRRRLRHLSEMGLVQSSESAVDKRTSVFHLTAEAARLLNELDAELEAILRNFLASH